MISERVAKKVERSGRRGRVFVEDWFWRGSVECSTGERDRLVFTIFRFFIFLCLGDR